MNLWIRSQDDGLYELKIILPPFADGSLCGKIEGKCVLLGNYKAKERALEVLDEIQKYKEKLELSYFLGIGEYHFVSSVFVMPKK